VCKLGSGNRGPEQPNNRWPSIGKCHGVSGLESTTRTQQPIGRPRNSPPTPSLLHAHTAPDRTARTKEATRPAVSDLFAPLALDPWCVRPSGRHWRNSTLARWSSSSVNHTWNLQEVGTRQDAKTEGQLEDQSCKQTEIANLASCSAAYTLRAGSSGECRVWPIEAYPHLRLREKRCSARPRQQNFPPREKSGFAFISSLTRHYSQ